MDRQNSRIFRDRQKLNRLFCSLLMKQTLGLDSHYLPGRENHVADTTLCLKKDSLTTVNSLLQSYPFLATYRCYYPPLELSLRVFNSLTTASKEILEPLRL